VLFERGAFTAADTVATADALIAFAAGLPAFVAIKVFQPSFYAREDTRTPTIQGGISVAVNVVASLALFPFIGHVGIAAATSLAAWVNALMLVIELHRRGHFKTDALLVRRLALLAVASLVMGAALLFGENLVDARLHSGRQLIQIVWLLGLCVSGMAVYGLATVLTGAVDVRRYAKAVVGRGKAG